MSDSTQSGFSAAPGTRWSFSRPGRSGPALSPPRFEPCSDALGVGYSRTTASVRLVPVWPFVSEPLHLEPDEFSSVAVAVAVGQRAAASRGRSRFPFVVMELGPWSSRCCGVAQSTWALPSLSIGIAKSDDEDSGSPMRCANVAGRHPQGADSIAESHDVVADVGEPAPGAGADVLDDDARGTRLLDDAAELAPQPGAAPPEAFSLAGGGDVLAGEAAADDDRPQGKESCSSDESDIGRAPVCVGPVPREDLSAEGLALHLDDRRAEACALQAEFESADAGEDRDDGDQSDHPTPPGAFAAGTSSS